MLPLCCVDVARRCNFPRALASTNKKETSDAIETVINTIRGLVRIVSPEPGNCMSEIEHLELAFSMCKYHLKPNVKPPAVYLGTMANGAGKVLSSHIQKSEGWPDMRLKAEASNNVAGVMPGGSEQ